MPQDILTWLKQPFSPDMTAGRWFLFLGLIIVLLWSWHMIFRELHEVEGAVT
jgi:hypothetical protein